MSNAHLRKPLFKGSIAMGATQYVGIPIEEGALGCQIAWLDATSAAAITLELTSYDHETAPVGAAGAAYKWKDSGVAITGPTGAAIASSLVNVEGIRQLRARLKIVASAACDLEILNGWYGA